MGMTLVEKVWRDHVVSAGADGAPDLLYIDLHLVHEVTSPQAFEGLRMIYYFVPKQAGRPVYSYRLSVVHFWALIFIYMWVGSHHLHYTALPDWTQSLGMVLSLILFAPS